MRTESTTNKNSTASITPAIVCTHGDDVAEVRSEPGYRLFVRFFDGTSGVVDLSALITSINAGVFAELRDQDRFAEVGIELGAVTWSNGLDLAPDAMYAAIRETGSWILR
jgi:hypothetical protein